MELKALKPMIGRTDPMSERIKADYELLEADFTPEELLHLVTEPLNVFLEEGEMTTLINDNKFFNSRSNKVNIVNNLLNRLMLVNSPSLSYKDTVYIENVLRKFGITDVNTFLTELKKVENEEHNTRRLINLYENNLTSLKNIVELAAQESHESSAAHEGDSYSQVLSVHNSIFKRLETADVYHELNLMYSQLPSNSEAVRPDEIGAASQYRTAERILLNNMRNYVKQESMPLTYREYNTYESTGTLSSISSREELVKNIISAAIMNVSGNAYSVYSSRQISENKKWLDFTRTFENSANDYFTRFNLMRSGSFTYNTYNTSYSDTVGRADEHEYRLLSQLIYRQEPSSDEEHPVTVMQERLTKFLKQHDFGTVSNNLTEIHSVKADTEYTTVEMPAEAAVTPEERQKREELDMKQTLDIINNRNLEKLDFITRQQNILKNEIRSNTINRTQGIRDSLKILQSSPEEQQELFNVTTPEQHAIEEYNEHLLELMDTETREIFRLVDEYRSNPGAYIRDTGHAMPGPEMLPAELHNIQKQIDSDNVRTVYTEHENFVTSSINNEIYDFTRLKNDSVNLINRAEETRTELINRVTGELTENIDEINITGKEILTETVLNESPVGKIITESLVKPLVRNEVQVQNRSIRNTELELVHKHNEVITDNDELIEELRRQRTELKNTKDIVSEHIDNEHHEELTVHNYSSTTTTEINTSNIDRYIDSELKRNMDDISERIYDRLEKKLVSENKRRGF